MRLVDILNIANSGYPGQYLEPFYDRATGEPVEDEESLGDTLALFVVREIRENYAEDEVDEWAQLWKAYAVISSAMEDLQGVVTALDEAMAARLPAVTP